MFEAHSLIISFFVLPSSCFIPNGLNHDLAAILETFKIHRVTKIHRELGNEPLQKKLLADVAVKQGMFANYMECQDIESRPSAVGAVFYPANREDHPCDLPSTETLVAGSSTNRPVFLFDLNETSVPRWLEEMYVPFNTSVNVILRDKREEGWLTLQEVYHLDTNGSQLVVNELGRREVDTDPETRWRMTSQALKVTRRADLRGTKIRSVILLSAVEQPTLEYSIFLLEANKTFAMACDFLNASAEEVHTDSLELGLDFLVEALVDLAIHPVVMAADTGPIDYTAQYSTVRHRIFIRRPGFTYSLRSVVQSFSSSTWIVIGFAIVALSATMTLANHVAQGHGLEPRTPWSESVVKTVGSACAQGWSRLPRSKSGRCVMLSTLMAGFLLNTFFVLQLQSGLSAQTAPLPFRGLDELVQTDYQIYTTPKGVAFFAIRYGTTDVAEKARKNSITENNEDIGFEELHFCEKRIAFIAATLILRMSAGAIHCPMVDTKVDLFLASVSFPLRMNFRFKELVDFSFRRAVEGGLVHRNERLYQGSTTDADDEQHFRVIELDKVEPFLFVYGCTLGFSVGVFFLELACFYWWTFWQKASSTARILIRRLRQQVYF